MLRVVAELLVMLAIAASMLGSAYAVGKIVGGSSAALECRVSKHALVAATEESAAEANHRLDMCLKELNSRR